MTVFLLERRGVYGQGVLGVFADVEAAKARAEAATTGKTGPHEDGDGWHEFVVMSCEIGSEPVDLMTWTSDNHRGTTDAPAHYYWKMLP